MCVCVRVCVCAYVCVHICVCLCVYVRVRVYVWLLLGPCIEPSTPSVLLQNGVVHGESKHGISMRGTIPDSIGNLTALTYVLWPESCQQCARYCECLYVSFKSCCCVMQCKRSVSRRVTGHNALRCDCVFLFLPPYCCCVTKRNATCDRLCLIVCVCAYRCTYCHHFAVG